MSENRTFKLAMRMPQQTTSQQCVAAWGEQKVTHPPQG